MKCIWCEKEMKSSLNTIHDYPIHKKCEDENWLTDIFKKIEQIESNTTKESRVKK